MMVSVNEELFKRFILFKHRRPVPVLLVLKMFLSITPYICVVNLHIFQFSIHLLSLLSILCWFTLIHDRVGSHLIISHLKGERLW